LKDLHKKHVIEGLLPFGVLKLYLLVQRFCDLWDVIEGLLPFGVLKLISFAVGIPGITSSVIEGLLPFGVLKLTDGTFLAHGVSNE